MQHQLWHQRHWSNVALCSHPLPLCWGEGAEKGIVQSHHSIALCVDITGIDVEHEKRINFLHKTQHGHKNRLKAPIEGSERVWKESKMMLKESKAMSEE